MNSPRLSPLQPPLSINATMSLGKMPCRCASPTHPSGTQSSGFVKTLPSRSICTSRSSLVIGVMSTAGAGRVVSRWCGQVPVARRFTTPQCVRCIWHAFTIETLKSQPPVIAITPNSDTDDKSWLEQADEKQSQMS